ncbi:hypothetical protein BGZ46_003512 [Entomortierella lignicola]|nr:hypothetical protein BGZ46_003512 [Entomortierella lignicola]
MATISIITVAAAASVFAVAFGSRKAYKAITADNGTTLPSGEYVKLSFGETRYYLFGPEDGKKVVFVHGLSSPSPVYDGVANIMASKGCRVLLYDLYSRGYSAGPSVDHDQKLYVSQLYDLLKHVGWTKCNFVGYSLGGGIVASFSHQFPEYVQSLTFISPGGLLSPSDLPAVAKIFAIPLSVEILSKNPIKSFFSKKNVESMLSEFVGQETPKSITKAVKIMELQFDCHAGYPRGLMSTLKSFPLTGLEREFTTSQLQKYPVQVIWGTKDTVIPGTSITRLQRIVPRVKVTNVEGATHSIVMTHYENIIEKLDGFVI